MRVAHARLLLEGVKFFGEIPYIWRLHAEGEDFVLRKLQKRLILVYVRVRILITVVSMAIDGWWGRIDSLKLRVVEEIATFFWPDEAEKAMKTAWVLL